MKYEDVVACIGDSERLDTAPAALHTHKSVSQEDWLAYMADFLRRGWHLLQELREEESGSVLELATFADWEEFCFRFSRPRPAAHYSDLLCRLDGLR